MRGDRLSIADPGGRELAIRTRRRSRCAGTPSGVLRRLDDDDSGRRGHAGLVVPLVFRDRPLGMLLAIDRLVDGPAFSERDEQLLQAFSTTAAAALATARTVAADLLQSRLAAAEAERNRWARELHDETLQALAMLRMTLSAAPPQGRRRGAQVRGDDRARAHRRADHEPARPDRRAAPDGARRPRAGAALEAFVERAARLGGSDRARPRSRSTRPAASGGRHVPELEATLYRIAQEAITNAIKHCRDAVPRAASRVREADDVVSSARRG